MAGREAMQPVEMIDQKTDTVLLEKLGEAATELSALRENLRGSLEHLVGLLQEDRQLA